MFPFVQHDNATGRAAQVHERDGVQGSISYTTPLIVREPLNISALNPINGREMAIDGSFGGTPVGIHDGLDSVLWTGSQIAGVGVTFNSTDRFNSGAQSVKVEASNVDDIWQFDRGSDLDLSGYVALTLFINVDLGWTEGDSFEIYGWDTGTATQVGTPVLLEDYFDPFTFDVWHKLSIPLSDMNLSTSTIDAIRMEMVGKHGQAPTFYIDDLQVEETTAGAKYDIIPPDGGKFLVHKFRFTLIGAFAGTVLNGTMPGLSYNQFLGVASLDSGILFTWERAGKPVGQASISNLGDAVKAGASIINHMSDGTNTSITILREFIEPIVLSSRSNDKICISINDDLSGLISLTAVGTGVIEPEITS